MFKKSTTHTEHQGESSQVELANPALQDIIASNDVIVTKQQQKGRISRACKAVLIVFILGLLVVGVVVLALVLAHSRNSIAAFISRSAEPLLPITNNSRVLLDDVEDTSVTSKEQQEEDWKGMIATSVSNNNNNIHQFTSRQVHLSSTIMMTKEFDQQPTRTNTPLLKYHSSSNTIAIEQSTVNNNPIQTTLPNRQETFSTESSSHSMTTTTTNEMKKLTTIKNDEHTEILPERKILTTITPVQSIQNHVTTANEEQPFTTPVFTTGRLIHSRFKLNTAAAAVGTKKNVLAMHNNDDDEDNDAIDNFLFS